MKTFKFLIISALLLGSSLSLQAGTGSSHPHGDLYRAIVMGGDTFIIVDIPTITIAAKRQFKTAAAKQAYQRRQVWMRDAGKIRQFAIELGAVKTTIDKDLAKIDSRKQRKQYLKLKEATLEKKFENRLAGMGKYQAELFLKLIHKETGMTCYDLIRSIKGKASSKYYKSMAKLKGIDLDTRYDRRRDVLVDECLAAR